jgi:methylenetetrahydrofolate dehydrogenase (NADP+) / methenyltetrahydrofolate cyclohydrolase
MDINGKLIAREIREEIKKTISGLKGRKPCLTVILVGDNPASNVYVNHKVKACKESGMLSILQRFPADISQQQLIDAIESLNHNPTIDGILVQLPLPDHINPGIIASTVAPSKDVDGFHPINQGKLLLGEEDGFIPCTPLGIQAILKKINVDPAGKHAVILGRSNIVGKPMAALLIQNKHMGNATVTIAHSRTENLSSMLLSADILIVAVGKPLFVKASMVKQGAVVIDVGINRLENNTLVGDVDYHNVKDKCLITPVPGGVGPMTIAMLLQNTLKSYRQTNAG